MLRSNEYFPYSLKSLNKLQLCGSHKMMEGRTICPCVQLSWGTLLILMAVEMNFRHVIWPEVGPSGQSHQ